MTQYQIDNEKRLSSLESDVQNVCKNVGRLEHEIHELKKVYSMIMTITENTSALTKEVKFMGIEIRDMKADIRTIKEQPILDNVYYKRLVFGGIVAAVITFIMGLIL